MFDNYRAVAQVIVRFSPFPFEGFSVYALEENVLDAALHLELAGATSICIWPCESGWHAKDTWEWRKGDHVRLQSRSLLAARNDYVAALARATDFERVEDTDDDAAMNAVLSREEADLAYGVFARMAAAENMRASLDGTVTSVSVCA